MRYYLGIDGGGTKTTALIMDAEGVERGRGTGGPGNVANNEDDTLTRSLQAAIAESCAAAGLSRAELRFAGVCAGVAGYSVEARRAAFVTLLRAEAPVEETGDDPAACYRLEPDYVIAYWGATGGKPGIVAIAGTGSVVYGRNEQGQTHREDGLGYLLGDRGSGFHLGLRVLRHTLAQMQAGESDALAEAITQQTGARTQNEILHWLYSGFNPERVAALAPVVGALADAGDLSARSHVAEIAHQLRICVRQTRHKLWLPRDASVTPLGGLWQIGAFLQAEFAAPHWQRDTMEARENAWLETPFVIAAPAQDAAMGAAQMARDNYFPPHPPAPSPAEGRRGEQD